MKYSEKHSKSIEIDESLLPEATRVALEAVMREGELRYRDGLIKMFKLMKSDAGLEQISLDALIKIIETVDGTEDGRTD